MEAGRPEIHGHPWLSSEFDMSLTYIRPCCKKIEINENLTVNTEKLEDKDVFSEMCYTSWERGESCDSQSL